MSVQHITAETFEQEVIRSKEPVRLDFWATWCAPCRMLSPILEEVADERPDVKVCKVNIDEAPELAQQYRIVSIPTMLVIRDGQVEGKLVGYRPKDDILELLE